MKSDTTSTPEQPPAPREKRSINPWLLIFGTAIGVVMLIAAVLFVVARLTPEQPLDDNERLMPDGSVLKIEAVQWGGFDSLAFSYSPSSRISWVTSDPIAVALNGGSGGDVLRIWMSRRDLRSGRSLDFDWWATSLAVNSLGQETADYQPRLFQINREQRDSRLGNRPFHADRLHFDTWVVSSSFPVFRTDEGRFQLKVKNTVGEVVATFDLTHPSPPQLQDWQAEELPATKTDRELSITLQQLRPVPPPHARNELGVKRWYFEPEYTLTENGQPTAAWNVEYGIADSFGELIPYAGLFDWTHHPTWRVSLVAYRKENSDFPASDTWSVGDVTLPSADTVVPLKDERTIDGATVRLVAIAGPGKTSYPVASSTFPFPDHQNPPNSAKVFDTQAEVRSEVSGSTEINHVEARWPHIAYRMSHQGNSVNVVLLKARDDQDREVPTQQFASCFFFKTEPDAKSLKLTVIVHRWRTVQFFIKPPDLPEDKPRP